MSVVKVSTKEEFERAVSNNEEKIIVTGDLAEKIISSHKKKAVAKTVGAGGVVAGIGVAVLGLVFAPFTGGVSAIAGLSATAALTAGGVTLTMAELALLCGTALVALGIASNIIDKVAKNYDVKFSAGSTTVEFTRK